MIAIVDYGMGNIRSVQKAFQKIGSDVIITSKSNDLDNAKAIVLPGVGAFKDCITNLHNLNIVDTILKSVEKGKPFLGICLGLQSLFEESEEFGKSKGLGLFKGSVIRFQAKELKIPHMGWNTVKFVNNPHIVDSSLDNSYFYFVHSYYVVPKDEHVIGGITNYGIDFVSMVCKDNIIATQFHPEKSQKSGLQFLKYFINFVNKS